MANRAAALASGAVGRVPEAVFRGNGAADLGKVVAGLANAASDLAKVAVELA
jgi:hypothetical protein